ALREAPRGRALSSHLADHELHGRPLREAGIAEQHLQGGAAVVPRFGREGRQDDVPRAAKTACTNERATGASHEGRECSFLAMPRMRSSMPGDPPRCANPLDRTAA